MWIELTDLADESALVDGEDYARRGRVEIVSAAAGQVRAVALGSSSYDVVLHADDWSCTCRQGGAGRFCKHLVATALVASGQTGAPDARAGTRPGELDEVTAWLGSLDEDSLRTVLVELGRRHPAAAKALAALMHSRTVRGPRTTGETSVRHVTESDDS